MAGAERSPAWLSRLLSSLSAFGSRTSSRPLASCRIAWCLDEATATWSNQLNKNGRLERVRPGKPTYTRITEHDSRSRLCQNEDAKLSRSYEFVSRQGTSVPNPKFVSCAAGSSRELRIRKDTRKHIILAWFWFGSSLDGLAVKWRELPNHHASKGFLQGCPCQRSTWQGLHVPPNGKKGFCKNERVPPIEFRSSTGIAVDRFCLYSACAGARRP